MLVSSQSGDKPHKPSNPCDVDPQVESATQIEDESPFQVGHAVMMSRKAQKDAQLRALASVPVHEKKRVISEVNKEIKTAAGQGHTHMQFIYTYSKVLTEETSYGLRLIIETSYGMYQDVRVAPVPKTSVMMFPMGKGPPPFDYGHEVRISMSWIDSMSQHPLDGPT